jgi:hypothetical protein
MRVTVPYGAWLLLVLGCLCCSAAAQLCTSTAPAVPQDRRANKEELVIAHYNTDWIVNETSHCGFEGASCGFDSPAEERQHIQCIAAEVRALNADILHLVSLPPCSSQLPDRTSGTPLSLLPLPSSHTLSLSRRV